MSLPNIEVVEPRHSAPQTKENGQESRRVTEVTVAELLQLEQLNGEQMGKLPDSSPKATEEMEVVVKLTDSLSVNLKCNANVTTVDLLSRLVSEIRDLSTQINSTNLEAKLTVPKEEGQMIIDEQKDKLSEALTQISTVKELLVKHPVPTLKLELSPRPNINGASNGTNTSSDSVGGSREVSRTSRDSERASVISLSPRPGSGGDAQGLTPRKKELTPRPAEDRPNLVAYMTSLIGDRAAISPEEKKILAKKFKRPTKRDKKSNNSSSALKKTTRTMRSTRTGGWVQTRPTGVPYYNTNFGSGEFGPPSPSLEKKSATLRAKDMRPPSPEDERHWTSTSPRSSTPPDEKIAVTRQNQKARVFTAVAPRLGNFLSVERQSLLSQSKVLKTNEKELAKEKLPTPIQKKHSIQVKLTCRLPENKVIEERFDIETAISDVKARIYELGTKAITELDTIDNYLFEFTDTKIYIFKENVTLKSLGIIDTQRSEYLTLALRSEALDIKNIVHKLNTILGGVVPVWDAKDSEESDFRKKIARNSPSTVFSNVPLAQLTEAPLPFDFPKKMFIRFRLPDQTTKTIECDAQDSLQTVLRTVAELTARQTQRQIAINDHVIKLCGRAQFILEDVVVNKIEYVRNAIERRKRIEFHLVPLAQLFEWLHYRAKANQSEFTRAAKRQVIKRVQTVESDEEEEIEGMNGKTSDEGLLLSTTVLSNTLHEDRASSDPTDATLETDLSPLNVSPRPETVIDTEADPDSAMFEASPRPNSRKYARLARILDPSAMKAAIKAQLSHERSRRTSYSTPRPSQDGTLSSPENTASTDGNNTNVVKTPGYAPESNPARLTHTASKAYLNVPEILRCQDFSLPFSVRIVGISRLNVPEKFARTLRSRETGVVWIEAVTVHRGEYLTQPTKTPIISLSSDPQWQVDLAIGPALRRLPRETRLVLTLMGARAGVEDSHMILGWTALPLFDFRGVMVRGELTRYMRLDEGVSPIGPVSDSADSKIKGVNKLELLFDDWGHDIYHVAPLPRIMNLDNYGKPSSHTIHQLQRILRTDTLWSPEPRDKQILWHYRYAILKEIPQLLNKLLLCIDWTNRTVLEEMYSLLDIWPALDPLDALELLDAKYSDTKVREYAVKCLHKFSDEELKLYLLQLMQVLKYEPHHYSALAQFLLDRACRSEVTLGVAFFWYLHAEVDSEYRERFALIMEAFLMHCSERQREEIFKQLELMKKLKEISIEVKEYPKDKRRDELIKRLKTSMVPRDFQLPLDPTIIVKRIDIEGCRVFDSAQAPLMLSLVLEDSCADPFPVIFKQGDDLRQDILTIQVLTIMDKMWKQNGLDLHLTRYAVLATSSDVGMIQVVTNAMTACKIQKAQGGALTGALKNSPLVNWIQEQNPNPQDFERAVDNFILSCAGYSVATYVLGVGDRHSDNIMVDRYGHFFHIDFGHFLGNFKYFGLLNRDKAPFAFPPEFAAVMGNKDSEKFKCFVEICCRAFNIVRANANVFLNLFAMMLSTGIAELRSEEDLLYLKGTMALHLNDDEAAELFRSLVNESLNTTATRINFLFHMWAH